MWTPSPNGASMAASLYRDTGYCLNHLIEDIKDGTDRAARHPAPVRLVGDQDP